MASPPSTTPYGFTGWGIVVLAVVAVLAAHGSMGKFIVGILILLLVAMIVLNSRQTMTLLFTPQGG